MNQEKFDEWANSYDGKRYDFFRRMQKRVLSQVELKEGASFLDVGCGTGWAVRQAAAMAGKNGRAYGIDLSAKMIEKAREAAQGIGNAEFHQANAEALPFTDSSFDRIICTMSFHHYLRPGKAVTEMARVLKSGGRVCIVDPTADSFIIRWVKGYLKWRQPEHANLYSSEEFRAFFKAAGLKYLEKRRLLLLRLVAKAHFAKK
jgi:ubiquinone/menaquinone biosynthesis C-methylase UbiE